MIKYAFYHLADGAISAIYSTANPATIPPNDVCAVPEGIGVIIDEHVSWLHWVDTTTTPHTLHQKTAHPLTINQTTIDADGEDECVITGIHNPSTVTWPDGFIETVTDGEVRFSVDLAGEYVIQIEAIPYLKETVDVIALPAN